MMKNTCIVGLAVVLMGLAGCKDKDQAAKQTGAAGSAAGRVAIVDLDKVAVGVGEMAKITAAQKQDQKDIGQKYDALVQAARAELEDMRKKLGPTPTPEQLKPLQTREGEMIQALQNQRKQAIDALNAMHSERVVAFRGQVKPIATRLAKAAGFSIILNPGAGLFWSEDSVDLTDKVIEEVNKLRQAGQFGMSATTKP